MFDVTKSGPNAGLLMIVCGQLLIGACGGLDCCASPGSGQALAVTRRDSPLGSHVPLRGMPSFPLLPGDERTPPHG